MTLPLGIRQNNPGNLRYNPAIKWDGQLGPGVNGLLIFIDMPHGVRAAAKDLRAGFREVVQTHGKSGEDTVAEIITEWAPPNENDTPAYIKAVCQRTGYGPDEVLRDDRPTIRELLKAIFHHENGGDFVANDDLVAGVDLAFA